MLFQPSISAFYVSDQICHARHPRAFHSRPQRGECYVSFWKASVRSPILISGLVSVGVGELLSLQKDWFKTSVNDTRMALVRVE